MKTEIEKQNTREIIFFGEICKQEGYNLPSDIENAYNIEILGC